MTIATNESTALAASAPVVTRDQLELVRRTVAVGATDAELELYLYDCQRRGVHPLDRLIHFTKRGGKYTPVVGIDYLRTRAAQTGEMAGSDDAVFDKDARTATVTVYRLTRGVRYPYTATARYNEYVPAPGQDHMWKKMPHTMLAKCSEAAALRKGFPAELGGLYIKEELEQARPDFVTEATAIADQYQTARLAPLATTPPVTSGFPPSAEAAKPEAQPDDDNDAREQIEVHQFTAERLAQLAPGVVLIQQVHAAPTKNPNVIRTTLTVAGNATWPTAQTRITTINERLAAHAEAAWHAEQAVAITTTKGKFGYELATIEDAHERSLSPPDALPDRGEDGIPF